ncbi:Chromatin remodeling protein EBS [Glycine soja]
MGNGDRGNIGIRSVTLTPFSRGPLLFSQRTERKPLGFLCSSSPQKKFSGSEKFNRSRHCRSSSPSHFQFSAQTLLLETEYPRDPSQHGKNEARQKRRGFLHHQRHQQDPGDCVLMRPSDTSKPPYVARVEKIEQDNRNNVKVRVRWYYRPEESIGGRRQFHGAKELFLSDHYDVQSAHTIEGKCVVHSFKNYTKLENVGAEDYYCRFEYKAATGAFTPDRVAVYCKCEMPYNPDDLMVQCEGCKDWYHPACVGMTIEEAKKLDHFVCSECSSDDDMKKPQATFPVSPGSDGKVRLPASSPEQFELRCTFTYVPFQFP